MKGTSYYDIGKVLMYPECCIKQFIEDADKKTKYLRQHGQLMPNKYESMKTKPTWFGSGFIPCDECKKKVNRMNREQLKEWLGRDVWDFKDELERLNRYKEKL